MIVFDSCRMWVRKRHSALPLSLLHFNTRGPEGHSAASYASHFDNALPKRETPLLLLGETYCEVLMRHWGFTQDERRVGLENAILFQVIFEFNDCDCEPGLGADGTHMHGNELLTSCCLRAVPHAPVVELGMLRQKSRGCMPLCAAPADRAGAPSRLSC